MQGASYKLHFNDNKPSLHFDNKCTLFNAFLLHYSFSAFVFAKQTFKKRVFNQVNGPGVQWCHHRKDFKISTLLICTSHNMQCTHQYPSSFRFHEKWFGMSARGAEQQWLNQRGMMIQPRQSATLTLKSKQIEPCHFALRGESSPHAAAKWTKYVVNWCLLLSDAKIRWPRKHRFLAKRARVFAVNKFYIKGVTFRSVVSRSTTLIQYASLQGTVGI
jgi:hypothetical protein